MALHKFSSRDELLSYLKIQNLVCLDSEFSPVLMGLAKAFNAKGIHVNRWWVMTPSDWECPACGRAKSQIVRLNRHEFLTGQLHEHHDHMKDLVRKRFGEYSVAMDRVVADELAEKFAVRVAFGLAAYDNTVICSDCNQADRDAKALVGTHKDFSYSPAEIRRFVIAQNNVGPHNIDKGQAKRIWAEGRELFDVRLDMIDQFARLAASNAHWYQPSTKTATQMERTAKYLFRQYGLDDLAQQFGTEPEKLLYTSVVFTGAYSSWRKKVAAPTHLKGKTAPTRNDLDHLVATRGNFWRKVPGSWLCPCCGRTKLSCVRPSKSNPWTFEVKGKPLFPSDDCESEDSLLLCDDCSNSANHLGREAAAEVGVSLEYPSSVVKLEELRSIVISQPHGYHRIDNVKADLLLLTLVERLRSMCEAS